MTGVQRTPPPPLGAVKIALAIFTGDKTMASDSLQSRLSLNCKSSGRTKSDSALTVEWTLKLTCLLNLPRNNF